MIAPGKNMLDVIDSIPRYIATPTCCQAQAFRLVVIPRVLPDGQLVVIARDDDTTFGILHSRFHEAWSLRTCTWLGKGNDPRYTPTTTFQPFPFPEGLSLISPPTNTQATRAQWKSQWRPTGSWSYATDG